MNKRAAFLLIAAAGTLLDFITKGLAFRALGIADPCEPFPPCRIEIIPGWLGFRASMNPGIVWGLFQSMPAFFTILACLAVPLIVVLFWRTPSPRWLFTAALGLILAGALGNLYDRLVFGKVRDFIDFYVINYPVFNVADSMICIGVGGLAWHLGFGPKPAPDAKPGGSEPTTPPPSAPDSP